MTARPEATVVVDPAQPGGGRVGQVADLLQRERRTPHPVLCPCSGPGVHVVLSCRAIEGSVIQHKAGSGSIGPVELTDVLDLLDALDDAGVDCLLAGARAQAALTQRGYGVIHDWLPTSVAYRDAQGREVDLAQSSDG